MDCGSSISYGFRRFSWLAMVYCPDSKPLLAQLSPSHTPSRRYTVAKDCSHIQKGNRSFQNLRKFSQSSFPISSHPGFSPEKPAQNSSDRKRINRIKLGIFIFFFLSTVWFSHFKKADYRTCRIHYSDFRRTAAGFLEVGVGNRFIVFWIDTVGFSTPLLLDGDQIGIFIKGREEVTFQPLPELRERGWQPRRVL